MPSLLHPWGRLHLEIGPGTAGAYAFDFALNDGQTRIGRRGKAQAAPKAPGVVSISRQMLWLHGQRGRSRTGRMPLKGLLPERRDVPSCKLWPRRGPAGFSSCPVACIRDRPAQGFECSSFPRCPCNIQARRGLRWSCVVDAHDIHGSQGLHRIDVFNDDLPVLRRRALPKGKRW